MLSLIAREQSALFLFLLFLGTGGRGRGSVAQEGRVLVSRVSGLVQATDRRCR